MNLVNFETADRVAVVDVTHAVQQQLADAEAGTALVFVKHTTAALLVSADEPNLRDDLVRVASGLLAEHRPFHHVQEGKPNGEAHILSALAGTHLCLPVIDGRLDLGRWQRLLLLELDGPQTRTVHIQLIAGQGVPQNEDRHRK